MLARKLLHLAAAAATTTMATCFACSGISYGARSTSLLSPTTCADTKLIPTSSNAPVQRPMTEDSLAMLSHDRWRRLPRRCHHSIARSAMTPAQEQSVHMRGGGLGASGQDVAASEAEVAVDRSLADSDPDVWEIINAEKRRQVHGMYEASYCCCRALL